MPTANGKLINCLTIPSSMKKKYQNSQLVAFIVLVTLFIGHQTHAQRYPAVFDPATIPFNGTNGFVVPGLYSTSKLGNEVRFIGDINNDGIEDIGIGDGDDDVGANLLSGRAFIIFGSSSGFPTPFDLSSLDGTNGFIVEGVAYDERRGATIAGPGDINGDGIDDLIIGSSNFAADEIVLYGATTFPPLITINDINGTNGFLINTIGSNEVAALGDVNGDRVNDFIIGTPYGGGQAWIIFGRTNNYPALLNASWLDGTNGFRTSNFAGAVSSYRVGGAGDINNDGYNDILLGSWNGQTSAYSYILFGKNTPFDALVNIEAVDGSDGFLIDNLGNSFITSVGSIGDINDDGIDDCFSENSVIFGSTASFSDSLFMGDLDGSNGFVLENIVLSAASTGDLNLDGIDDFIVASIDDYVVFGTSTGFPSTFNPSVLDGTNGFKIPIIAPSGLARSVDGGKDINGDGVSDFIVGDVELFGDNGKVYVVFGGDFIAPSISCPANQELCAGAVIPNYTSLATATDNEDPNPIITQSPAAGSAFTNGMVITLTATDANNNASDCNFTINQIVDTTDPAITCPVNQSLAFGATVPDYTGLATATDNCGVTPAITQSPVAGTAFTDDMSITLTATDASGNTSNCSFIINKLPDTTAPTITCPGNQELTCTDTTIPDYTSLATATDTEDPNPIITQSPAVGSTFTDGMAITLTATDASGNASNCTFTVSLLADTTDPVITCPANQSLAFGATVPDYTGLATGTDNCGSPAITQSPVAGTAFTDGMSITLTAMDGSGNTSNCSFIINKLPDTTAPTITCPANQELCAGAEIPDYTSLATVTDIEDPNPVITQSPAAGTPFTMGMTITLTATDANGNASNCTFTVNLLADITNPVITCPGNQSLAFGATVPDYTGLATATDNCGVTPAITQFPAAATVFTDGMSITLTATDGSGNTSNCSFIINQLSDITPPNITCSGNQELTCSDTTIPDYTSLATATDAEDPNPVITQIPAVGSTFTDGMTITLTATDASGNASNCTFTVNLLADTENPVISCLANQSLAFGATVPDYTGLATTTDNCGSPTITQSPAVGTAFTDGMTITLTATDGSSNTSSCSFIINKLPDTTAPSITCTATQELTCNDTVIPDYTGLATATDAEDSNPIITQSPVAGTAFTDDMTITLTATDASSNTSSCTFTVNLLADTENPIITTCPANQSLAFGATIPDYTGLATATDNCGVPPAITQSPAVGTAFTDGMSITLIAMDGSGNTSNCSFIINKLPDTTAPTITCPANQELCAGAEIPDYTGLATATDAEDSNPVITQSPAAGTAFTDGMAITLTATDASGNASNCTFTVNLLADTENPVISTCPANQLLAFGATVPDYTGLATATDNCGVPPAITQSPAVGTAFTDGMSITLTATDGSSNTSSCSFIINKLLDTTAPTITCPANQELCAGAIIPDYTGLATATDGEDSNPIITQSPVAGTAFTNGMAITLTATDVSGNASNCNFAVTELPAPSVSANTTATTVCTGEEVTLTASGNAESYRWNNGVTDGVAFVPNTTTTYTVIGTDTNGCEASAQITIAVNSVPAQPTIAVNGDILTSSSAVGNQWFMDDAAINGATEQSYTIAKGSAVYTVQVTIDGCTSDMSDPVIITGLNELVANNALTIWPNPVTNQLFVQLSGTSMVYHYLIINSIGTIVKSGKFKKTELVQHFDVALQELRSGIYTIQVSTDKGLLQAKFVKK